MIKKNLFPSQIPYKSKCPFKKISKVYSLCLQNVAIIMSSESWQKSLNSVHERNQYMLQNKKLSDIIFIFEKNEDDCNSINAHKFELAKGSGVFEKLFYGGENDNIKELIIKDFSRKSFNEMIKYLYLDEIEVTNENALDILNLSRAYGINGMELKYSDFITKALSVENVSTIIEESLLLKTDLVQIKCVKFIEENTNEIFQHPSLMTSSKEALSVILNINSNGCVTSVFDYFNFAMAWAKNQCIKMGIDGSAKNLRNILGEIFYSICFPNMEVDDFVMVLHDDHLFTTNEIGQIFLYIHLKKKREIKFNFQKKEKQIECLELDSIVFENYDRTLVGREHFVLKMSASNWISLYRFDTTLETIASDFTITDDLNQVIYSSRINDGYYVFPTPIDFQPGVVYEFKFQVSDSVWAYFVRNKEKTVKDVSVKTIENPSHPWNIISEIHFKPF